MNHSSFPPNSEKHLSQIPALQVLMNLGFTYLPPSEALAARGGKVGNVLLEGILWEIQRKSKDRLRVSDKTTRR